MRDKKMHAEERRRRRTAAQEKRSGIPQSWQEAEAQDQRPAQCAMCAEAEHICFSLCPNCPGLCEVHCKV